MKKISSFILTAGAFILAASCAKELNVADPTPENGKVINITVIATEKPAIDEGTKTFIDGTSVKWTASDEKLNVFEVATPAEGDVVTTQATTAEGVTNDGGATMSFGVSMADKSSGSYNSFDYYAVYPSSAYQSGSTVTAIALNTKGAQTPTATNFDASQDLLIAKKIENGTSQASTLEMQFARVVAIGKMTIKNLETTDPITKITFSAKVGSESVALAGRTAFDLETAKPVTGYASNTQDYSIILDYEGQNITANTTSGMVAYFTCYPFAINATTPGSFKVVVETATESFTKEVNVSSEKGLAFNIGKASVFSVNMDGIAGETKAVDLRYAYLDYNDFSSNGGTTSYGNVTVNKTHGDSWVMYALGTNNAIGVRRNDKGDNDSYIKLPDFSEDIKTVVVTMKNVTADNTITLETSATASNGSIASLTTSAATVYTFDLTSSSVKTAYFRSKGVQALVEKIEVYAGDDNRVVLSAPANVAASLNADTNNAIDVSWDAVDGAGSYLISLMDEDTNITTKIATSSPFTVTALEHEMEYLIAVKAIPSDPYVNKESPEADAPSAVTTGAGSTDYSVVETSNVTLTAGTNGSDAQVNGNDAIKVGTSSKGGDMTVTVPAGTTKLHLHAAAWNGVSGLSLNITGATVSPASIALTDDSGIANSSPFTLAGDPADFYFVLELSDITADTDITFSSSIAKRFVVWGVNAEAGPSITWNLESIAITTEPDKTVYTEGQSFDSAGMVVTGHFVDADDATNTKDEAVTGYTITPDGALATTDTQVTITYQGKTTTQAITVNAAGSETPSVQYTLTPSSGTNNSYAGNCDIDIDGITWNLTGNSQQIPWRIGGKSLSGVDRALYSKTALAKNISKIEITHGAASSITVNSMTVTVASDADFSNVVSTLTPTFAANSTITIDRPIGKDWSNCYYKIVYNVTVSGSSNKYIEFSEAKFYGTN